MRPYTLLIALVAALFLPLVPAQAQKQKKPTLPPGDLFFTMKGQPFALERIFPGIQGTLLLTDDQKQKLGNTLEETLWSEAARSGGRPARPTPTRPRLRRKRPARSST